MATFYISMWSKIRLIDQFSYVESRDFLENKREIELDIKILISD